MDYKNGYHKEHPVIRLFWTVFYDLPIEAKKKFLGKVYSQNNITCRPNCSGMRKCAYCNNNTISCYAKYNSLMHAHSFLEKNATLCYWVIQQLLL